MKYCYQCGLSIEYSLEMGTEDFCGEGCYEEMLLEQRTKIANDEAAAAKRIGILCGFEEEQ